MNKKLEGETSLEKAIAKKKTVKKSSEDEVLNKNSIEINPKMNEATTRTVVLGWGRMNPITSGHEILIKRIKAVAKENKATPIVYITHSQDKKKNPLSYDDKVMLAKKAFGNIIQKSTSKTIMQVMKELEDRFDKVILVTGDDRVAEFTTLLNKYNGTEYSFKEIEIASAGSRADPDSDEAKDMTATNMSASVMRRLASEGDIDAFKKGLPKSLQSDYKEIYDMVRGGMKIAEMMEEEDALIEALNVSQRRARAFTMRKYRTKIDAAKKRLSMKAATVDMITHRARQAAIKILRRKLAGKQGMNYANLNPAEKMMIDKRVEKRKGSIEKIARRLIPTVRRADLERLSAASASKKESADTYFEEFLNEVTCNTEFEVFIEKLDVATEMPKSIYTKRYHQMYTKEGSIKLDKRFRAFREKKIEEGQALDVATEKHKSEKVAMVQRHSRERAAAKIRDIRTTASEEFDTDEALLRFIEETTDDIRGSLLLDEEKSAGGLKDKADKSGISLSILQKVYNRGIGAWQTSHRPGTTPQQWAYARVNSFITGGKTRTTGDADLWAKHSGKKPPVKENISEVGGAGDESTSKLANRYKKDTPGQTIAEVISSAVARKQISKFEELALAANRAGDDEKTKYYQKKIQALKQKMSSSIRESTDICTDCEVDPCICDDGNEVVKEDVTEEVSQRELADLEKFADRLLSKFKIDVEFTRHFADRMNDPRNRPAITVAELEKVFKKVADGQGMQIRRNPDIEAVLKDIQSDLNLPIVINYDKNKDEFEVVNKTIMRKKNFSTTSKVLKI